MESKSSADVIVEEPDLRLDRLARRRHELHAAALRGPRGPHLEALVGLLVDQPPLLRVDPLLRGGNSEL